LPNLNVPLQIGKCTPGGTCTPGWEPLVYMVYAFFIRKMTENQFNIQGVCRCHASINLFWLRKIFVVFFFVRYKTILTLL